MIIENETDRRESVIRNNDRLLVKYFKMKITVLSENSECTANTMNVKPDYGLTLFIEFEERIILFETGQSDLFIQNAAKMGIPLSQVDYLVIANGHYNHEGGLKHFLQINKKAKIFLHITAAQKSRTMIIGSIPYYVGPDKKIIAQKNRIYFIDEDTQIEEKIILLEGFREVFQQPEANKASIEKTYNQFFTHKFYNELVMLLIENDEIVLFSGWLHSGIISTIEEVKLFSKTMRIKATFFGGHINDLIFKKQVFEI